MPMRAMIVLLVALALAGCASQGGAVGKEEKVRLAPKGYKTAFHEVDVNATKGAVLALRFTASALVTWDIHTHVGETVEALAMGTGDSGNARVEADHDGVYSLFFQNMGPEPVDVTFTFEHP